MKTHDSVQKYKKTSNLCMPTRYSFGDYIHKNPIRAGIVYEPQHYKYSNALFYFEDREGQLPIERMF